MGRNLLRDAADARPAAAAPVRLRLVALLAHAIAAGVVLFAQTQPPAAQQPPTPTFRTGTNVVRVDVSVIDRRGNPVPALSADDFEVEEDGIPQTIQSLKYLEVTGQPAAGDDISLEIRSPEHAAAEAARDDVRVFVIFWDEYHIDQFIGALRAREALSRFLATSFAPRDLVALMDPLTPIDALRFTRNFGELADAVRKLRGRLGVFIPSRSAAEEAQLRQGGDVRRLRAEVTLSALESAVVHLGGMREGRKSILFVSQGLRALGTDADREIADVVRAANEGNTAIYTFDPRGLIGRVSDTLVALAEDTGAAVIRNGNTPEGPLRQIVKDASAFYLLGYSSAKNPADGKFHRIRVRVKKDSLEVRARRGYWAPSAEAMATARAEAAAAEPPSAIADALSALTPSTARRLVDIWTGVARDADGRPLVRVTWAPRASRGQIAEAATLSVQVKTPEGKVVVEGPLDRSGNSIPLAAGGYQLHMSVRDVEGQIVDSEVRPLTVPEASAPIAFGTPVIVRARTPLELRAATADPDAPAWPGRDFSRGDRLLIRAELYGRTGITVTARLLSRRGSQLAALPVAPLSGRSSVYQIDLPAASIAPGIYVVELAAEAGEQRTSTYVAFQISQ